MPVRIILLLLFLSHGQTAQRQHSTDCDVMARVNRDVITRDDYSAELNDYRETLVRELKRRGKDQQHVDLEFERAGSSVLDQMIDDLLLEQRVGEA